MSVDRSDGVEPSDRIESFKVSEFECLNVWEGLVSFRRRGAFRPGLGGNSNFATPFFICIFARKKTTDYRMEFVKKKTGRGYYGNCFAEYVALNQPVAELPVLNGCPDTYLQLAFSCFVLMI